jgi:hypothetical protein
MKTKKILKEQEQSQTQGQSQGGVNDIESQKQELRTRLESYVNRGCTPGGKVISMSSGNPQYSYSIKQESTKTPGKFRYLYEIKNEDGTLVRRIAEPNAEGKLTFTKKWYCDVDSQYTEPTNFERQKKTPQQQNAIQTFLNSGWEDKGGIINPVEAALFETLDMKDEYPNLFTDSYILVKEIKSIDTNQLISELTELVNTNNFADRKTCRQIINKYNVAKQKNAPINDAVLKNWKSAVNMCESKVRNFNDLGITKKLLETLKTDTENQRWSLSKTQPTSDTQTAQPAVNENHLRLKNIIRENLNELSESKKKSLVEEYKIINTRFKIISESGKPKTKKQKEKLVDDLLSEMFYLKSQGFNEKLINEEFLDIIKSFFGNVPGGIFDTIKERLTQTILNTLGVDTSSYLANIFIATMGNIPIADYVNGNIFKCEYITKTLSKGIGEGIVRKIQNEQKLEGYLYDIIRNSLVDTFTDTRFGQKVEGLIGQLVCPSLSKIKGRMDSTGETMKSKALS